LILVGIAGAKAAYERLVREGLPRLKDMERSGWEQKKERRGRLWEACVSKGAKVEQRGRFRESWRESGDLCEE
jgi:hypothetical protein